MKSKLSFAGAALLAATMLTAAPAAAQMRSLADPVVGHPDPESLFTSKDKTLHKNKQAALRIQRELLKCGEWARAGEWLTDKYIQHNPIAASGLKGVQDYFVNVAKIKPTRPCPALSQNDPNAVVMVSAEGDYVTILTKRIVPYADDASQSYTTTWFDTWRFVDGKADEHWDPMTLPTGPAPAPQASASDFERETRDRAAIEELMWTYVRAIDGWKPDAYAAVFTEDGAFLNSKGRPALKKMVEDLKADREKRAAADGKPAPELHHFMANQTIEFVTPDHARVKYYWQTVTAGSPGAAVPQMLAAGRGVDDVVRVGGKWLIQNRNVAPQAD